MSMALDDKQQGHDDHQLPELAEPRSTAEVAEALAASGMVDELLAQIDTGQVQITPARRWEPRRLRLQVFSIAARLTRHARRARLKLAATAPHLQLLLDRIARLAALRDPG